MMRYRLMTHRTPRTIRYRGKVYRGWQALADDYGLSVSCAQNRIDRGIPLDLPKQKNGAWLLNQPVEYDGREWKSVRALARAMGTDMFHTKYYAAFSVPKSEGWDSVWREWWKV